MKKMLAKALACLLLAAMLIPCAAVAELDVSFEVPSFADIFTPAAGYKLEVPDVPTVQWSHPSGAISALIPEEWTEVEVTDGSIIAGFLAEDQIGSMSISVSNVDGSNIVTSFDEIKRVFTEQYEQQGCIIESFELSSYGGRDAIVFQFSYLGVQQTQVMIQPSDNSALIIFGFSASAQKHIRLVMESVWLDD